MSKKVENLLITLILTEKVSIRDIETTLKDSRPSTVIPPPLQKYCEETVALLQPPASSPPVLHFDAYEGSILVTKLAEAVEFAYSLRRRNRQKDIPWDGPEISQWVPGANPVSDFLSESEIGGEDADKLLALHEIIWLAIKFGASLTSIKMGR